MTDLAGRTALVTGGGTGLGAAIARALHAAGATVVVVGRRPEPLEAVVAGLGERASWRVCDVADPASVDALADALARNSSNDPGRAVAWTTAAGLALAALDAGCR